MKTSIINGSEVSRLSVAIQTVAPEVPLTLVSDASRLSDYIDFQARASARSFEQSLTLQINSGQSTAGG